jgi:hypothetical protein
MTDLLISTALTHDVKLTKIGATLYYDAATKTMYRLSFLPSGVVFYNEDVIQPHLISFTKYDPYFLAINILSKRSIQADAVPEYLQEVDLNRLADLNISEGSSQFTLNNKKTFDFLETKVEKLHKCFSENFQANYIMT